MSAPTERPARPRRGRDTSGDRPLKVTHTARSTSSTALGWAKDLLEHRVQPTRATATVSSCSPPTTSAPARLDEAVHEFLAWRYVHQNADTLGLGGQQTRQALTRMQRHDTVVADRLLETYIWAILPTQAPDAPTYTRHPQHRRHHRRPRRPHRHQDLRQQSARHHPVVDAHRDGPVRSHRAGMGIGACERR